MKKIMIFLNYCSKDQYIVDRLRARFQPLTIEYQKNGVTVELVAMDEYCSGRWDEWMTSIARDCDIMIPILTDNSMYPEDASLKYINDELRIGRKYGKNMVPFVFSSDVPDSFDAHIGGMSQVWYVDGDSTDASYDEVVRKARLLIDGLVEGSKVEQLSGNSLIGVQAPRKNRFFVGRERELDEIHSALSSSNIMILKGEGGIGKTSLAEAYFARHSDSYSRGYIVNASLGIVKCITDLPFEGNEHIKNDDDKYRASIKKLSSYNEKTIIILDNCDVEIDENELTDLKNTKCHYIITSRIGQSELSEINTVNVGKMTNDKLLEMFYSRYPEIASDNGMTPREMDVWLNGFFDFVGGHTLAVEMASVIMRDADVPIEDIKTALFDCRDKIFTANKERMSAFHYLSVIYDFARLGEDELRILRVMSLIGTGVGIDRRVLKRLLSLDTTDEIRSLVKNTFIRENGKRLLMHPLFSDVFYRKENVSESDEARLVVEHLSEECGAAPDMSRQRELCELMEFVIEKRREIFDRFGVSHRLSELSGMLANCLYTVGSYEKSIKYYKLALSASEKGASSVSSIVKCHIGIGAASCVLGSYDAAVQSLDKARSLITDDLSDHEVLRSKIDHELGRVYTALGDYARAKESLDSSISLGEGSSLDALTLARSYNDLGGVFGRCGEFSEALRHYERAIELYGGASGDTVELAECYKNFGITYEKMGEYSRSIDYHKRSIDILERLYADLMYSGLADVYAHLGNSYRRRGEPAPALAAFEKAMLIYNEVYSSNLSHPRIADVYNNIGNLKIKSGDYDAAIACFEKDIEICKQVYGEGRAHPKLANPYNNIGIVWYERGDYVKALEYFGKALDIRVASYGSSHHTVGVSNLNVGRAYLRMNEAALAEHHLTLALRIFEDSYPGNPSHPNILDTKKALSELVGK